jgi:hypothetical protein
VEKLEINQLVDFSGGGCGASSGILVWVGIAVLATIVTGGAAAPTVTVAQNFNLN